MQRFLKCLIPKQLQPMLGNLNYAIQKNIHYQAVKRRKQPFFFNGESFRYFSHHFNHTYYNERAVELPIILRYLEKYQGKKILEVGNVTGHYANVSHIVVDKFEKGEKILNEDIINYTPTEKYDLIISISTFEHIGYDERIYANDGSYSNDPRQLIAAVENTKHLLAPAGEFLLTIPMGYNPFLDEQIASGGLGMTDMWFLKRTSQRNLWEQVSLGEIRGIRYGMPFRPCANGLAIARYIQPSTLPRA